MGRGRGVCVSAAGPVLEKCAMELLDPEGEAGGGGGGGIGGRGRGMFPSEIGAHVCLYGSSCGLQAGTHDRPSTPFTPLQPVHSCP